MVKKKIVIDAATIFPGIGGAGGGIWNYTKNLLLNLDKEAAGEEIEFICLVNPDFDLPLRKVKVKMIKMNLQSLPIRILYTHILLPVYVALKKATLHKLYFEVPLLLSVNSLVTIHDCMGDYYKKNNYSNRSFSERLKSYYFHLINRIAIKRSKVICTPSQFIKEELLTKYSIPEKKVIVTPLATDCSYKESTTEVSNHGNINLYCIAAFHKHKGHLRLLKIFEEVFKKNNNVYLSFRGHIHDLHYYNEIIEQVKKSPAKSNIKILDYQNKISLEDIYSKADWLILLSEYEGFGLPVIEAQALATPVICSDISTFKEVAGGSVFYIDNKLDESTVANQLSQILADNDKRRDLIHRGLINAQKYSWAKFSKQMLEVYKKMP